MGLSLLGLMACGQKTDNSGGNSSEGSGTIAQESGKETAKAEGKSNSDVTLSVSIWDTNQEPGLEEIMADFTKETGIKTKITVVRWADYWTAMEAAAQGGSLPDVFWMHSNESERYMSNDMLLDLTDKIKASDKIKVENYPEDIWGLYTYKDHYYAVPKDIDTIAIWYNKKLFDEAGVPYPTSDWTWDDLTETARKLTKSDGSQYGLAVKMDNNQAGYYNLIYGGWIAVCAKIDPSMGNCMTRMFYFGHIFNARINAKNQHGGYTGFKDYAFVVRGDQISYGVETEKISNMKLF